MAVAQRVSRSKPQLGVIVKEVGGKSEGRYVGIDWSGGVEEANRLLCCCLSACWERGVNQDTR